ncbi:hypothetical protein FJZ53_02515 [Candidatus Woesearchaeota archaeon]|nr:hypothetical protein [Candidatus Woesearchaeota archaeon]
MVKKILVSPFDWGLGHATRDIPIINELLKRGYEVDIANHGSPKVFLEKEFPELNHIELPPYPIPYTTDKFFSGTIVMNLPLLLSHIRQERKVSSQIIEKKGYDLVISDNRFEMCSPKVPSFLITHQLMFKFPQHFKHFEILSKIFNARYYKWFDKIIVPDFEPDTSSIAGELSRRNFLTKHDKIYYAGPFSHVEKKDVEEDIDYFVSISGPEPQRTNFEKVVLKQIDALKGRVVVSLGEPERDKVVWIGGAEVRSNMNRFAQLDHLNRAKTVISRPGYTTVMELLELGKKAMFIPTPGQTEQEYLAMLYKEKGWFYSISQDKLNFEIDLEESKSFTGFPSTNNSKENVKKLIDEIIEPAL